VGGYRVDYTHLVSQKEGRKREREWETQRESGSVCVCVCQCILQTRNDFERDSGETGLENGEGARRYDSL
jgi:hypothetical protein